MFDLIREVWRDGPVEKLLLALVALLVLLLPATLYGVAQEQKEWERFYATHNCKKVGHMRGDVQTGIGFGVTTSGNTGTVITTTVTPDQIGYACDDGVTYWR